VGGDEKKKTEEEREIGLFNFWIAQLAIKSLAEEGGGEGGAREKPRNVSKRAPSQNKPSSGKNLRTISRRENGGGRREGVIAGGEGRLGGYRGLEGKKRQGGRLRFTTTNAEC